MPQALRKVIVVFKTHFDLGFTDLPERVMQLYTGKMFSQVREVMDATANEPEGLRYSWTLPAWPLKFLLHDTSVPEETRQAARKLVEEGRLNWHAWPFTTHTAFCGLEELVRGLHVSRSLSEEFGCWPTGAKQTDVPGHTWILPSMLVRAGVKFLHLGCNSGSHAPHVPRLFWWEGPDGSRLLTYYSPGGYGTPLLPPDDWPLDTWLAVQQTVDNVGPQSPEELKRIRRTVEEGAPGVELVFGELGDFADSLMEHPEQLGNLPVVPYDLADTWIHGVGTMPREVARVRELRGKLLELEQQCAMYDWPTSERAVEVVQSEDFPLARKVAPLIDAAYEQLLLFGEHTWGLDVKSTIKRAYGDDFEAARQTEPYRRLESSWVAKAAYVDMAEELFGEASRIADQTMSATPHNLVSKEKADEAEALLAETVAAGKLYIDNVPDNVLENNSFRLEVDPAMGGIVSLISKASGHEWVDKSNPEPFGGYRYDLYSIVDIAEFMRAYGLFFQDWFVQDFGKQGYPEDSQHIRAYARDFKLEKVRGEEGSSLRLTGGRLRVDAAKGLSLPEQTVSIEIKWADRPFPGIDLEYRVVGKEATPLAESTVVPFPLKIRRPSFRLGQTGSVIDPVRDIVAGANRSLWCADWLYAGNDSIGFGIITTDMPLVSIGNTGIYRFESDRVPTEPPLYAHLSNTQWGTNFPQWLEGDFRWKLSLSLQESRYSWLLMDHYARWTSAISSNLRHEWDRYFKVQNCHVLAVRPRHDGRGLIVRVGENHGAYRTAWLQLQDPIVAIWRCDLMERPIEKLTLYREHYDGGPDIALPLAPYAIETLLIEFDKQ